MNRNRAFDDFLSSTLKTHTVDVTPSKDIFAAAWLKNHSKDEYTGTKFIKTKFRFPIITVCLILISFLLAIYPNSRNMIVEAYNALKTIFIIEKIDNDYILVEKPQDSVLVDYNLVTSVDESNKNTIENLLDFKSHFPKTLGNNKWFLGEDHWLKGWSFSGITIFDIAPGDAEELRDTLLKAIEDDVAFSQLSNYDISRYIATQYLSFYSSKKDKYFHNNNFFIFIQKDPLHYRHIDIIDEFYVEDIACKIIEVPKILYPQKLVGTMSFIDKTQTPDIYKYRYITWEHNDLTYTVQPSPMNQQIEFNEDNAVEFVKAYLDSLINH